MRAVRECGSWYNSPRLELDEIQGKCEFEYVIIYLRYKIRSRSIEQYGGFETRLVPQAAEVIRFRMYVAETILTETYHGDERVTFFFFLRRPPLLRFFLASLP